MDDTKPEEGNSFAGLDAENSGFSQQSDSPASSFSHDDDTGETGGNSSASKPGSTEAVSKAGFYIEILILSSLILLNVLDFFGRLTPELDYIKKIISWTALGYILYKASLSNIFFGEKYEFFDVAIVIGYFTMVLKNFIHYARIVYRGIEGGGLVFNEASGTFIMEEAIFQGHVVPNYLVELYTLMVENEGTIMITGLAIGFGLMFVLALYVAKNIEIKSPSLLDAIGIRGESSSTLDFYKRFFACIIIFMSFFVVVFNLVMEWLAIAVDAPLLMVGLAFYMFSGNLKTGEKLEKLGNFGSDFYQEFIGLFQKRETIIWGVSGMLVLHIVTDIPNLLFPYILGFAGLLYSGAFDDITVWELAAESLQNLAVFDKVLLVIGYFMNVIGIMFLMLAPVYIWYHIYREKEFDFGPIIAFLFGSSVAYYLFDPLFVIGSVESSMLLGVSMGISAISPNILHLALSVGIGIGFIVCSLLELPKKVIVLISTLGIQFFFLRHMYLYLMSNFNFYSATLVSALSSSDFHIAFFLGVIGFFTLACQNFGFSYLGL